MTSALGTDPGGEAFRYSTFFSFKPGTPDSVRDEFVRRWNEFMNVCREPQSPELNTPRPGQKPRPGQNFELFSTMVFRNQADCDAYLDHPLHVSLHEEIVLPNVDLGRVFGGTYSYKPCRAG